MSTSFNFPANPTLNQIVVLPDGNSAQWNGTAWVSVANNVTYPLSIPNGGTGATNPSTARVNLGLDTATGERIIPKDGTIAAPALAWAGEPGLGWFRSRAGQINMTAQGVTTYYFDASAVAGTVLGINSRIAGNAIIYLNSQPNADPNYSILSITSSTVDYTITEALGGTATSKKLRMAFPAGVRVDAPVNAHASLELNRATMVGYVNAITGYVGGVQRWQIQLGNGTAACDFSLGRMDASGTFLTNPISISSATGCLALGNIQTGAIGSGGPSTEISIRPADHYITGSPTWPATGGGLITVRGNTSGSYSAGAVSCYSGSGNTGAHLYAGQTSWNTPSDERLKNIMSDITNGLEAVLAMRPIRYRYKTDDPDFPLRAGLTAQSVQIGAPEAVDGPSTDEGYLHLRMAEVVPYLVSAFKAVNARLAQLEKS
jgi:hypothetical protein